MERYLLPRKRKANENGLDAAVQPGPVITNFTEDVQPGPVIANFTEDVGLYIGKMSMLSDHEKFQLLTNHWKGGKEYKYPTSEHTKRGRAEHRRPQLSNFETYKWLVFSQSKNGLFCKNCAIFQCSSGVGHNQNESGKRLVTEPLQSYSKLTGKDGHLLTHSHTNYHKRSTELAENFLKTLQKPEADVRNAIDSGRLLQVASNRKRLSPTIKTILFHGRQNVPLRGHRDDGCLMDESHDPVKNEGNFRELLRFRVDAGDEDLKDHLESAGANATYISKTTCNDLIDCIGQVITEGILAEVREAKYYCIIFDETTDNSHKSQLSLSIRYFNRGIKECFLGFLEVQNALRDKGKDDEDEHSVTGKALGQCVLQMMKNLHLDLNYCCGIGCDGCSVNVSEAKGAVTEIKKEAPYASLCPCKSHQLNLSISKCISVPDIRNALGTVEEIIAFFNGSSKRHAVLVELLGHNLTSHCRTRWVERHDSILQFKSDLIPISEALEKISSWSDRLTASKANMLLIAVSNCSFVIAIHSLSSMMAVTKPLSQILQKVSLDYPTATSHISATVSVLQDMRQNAVTQFSQLLKEVMKILELLGENLQVPRLGVRQTHRNNVVGEPEEYFRRRTFIPLLDEVLNDIQSRFTAESVSFLKLEGFLPQQLEKTSIDDIPQLIQDAVELVPNACSLTTELLLPEVQLALKRKDLPTDLTSLIDALDGDFYPNLKIILTILATLPVTAATAERSFSTLRALKTWMRSRMTEDRLNGLALMNVHRSANVSIDKVIDLFARKNRRLPFVL